MHSCAFPSSTTCQTSARSSLYFFIITGTSPFGLEFSHDPFSLELVGIPYDITCFDSLSIRGPVVKPLCNSAPRFEWIRAIWSCFQSLWAYSSHIYLSPRGKNIITSTGMFNFLPYIKKLGGNPVDSCGVDLLSNWVPWSECYSNGTLYLEKNSCVSTCAIALASWLGIR